MGIFDRIFKREEQKDKEVQSSCKMTLDDIDTWVEEESKKRQESLVSEMQSAVKEILQLKDTAREIVEEIRDYKPPPEIKKRMFKPVLTAKPKYIKGVLDGLAAITPPSDDTYDALVDFNARTLKALKIIHKTQINQGNIIAMFFQEELPRLGTALNSIIDLQKSIGEEIEDRDSEEENASGIKTAASELRGMLDIERHFTEDVATAQEEITALEAERAKHEEELKRLRGDEAYQKLVDIEKDLTSVQERLAAVEGKGRNLMGPLLRIFRKYVRVLGDKEAKKVANAYIKNSQAAFFDDPEGAVVISRILREVCDMSRRGELVLGKKEREKVDRAMSNLGAVKQEHTAIKKEEQHLKETLASSSVRKKEATITAGLKRIEEDIKRLYTEVENTRSRAEEKKQEIKRLKDRLEKNISEKKKTGVTIEI